MLTLFLAMLSVAGEPRLEARTVAYHEQDILSIPTQLGFVTEIHLPKGEVIMTDEEHAPRCGNKTFFQVNASGNVLYVQPMDFPDGKEGGKRTNIDISMASGNHMSLLVYEVSKMRGAQADLKIFVEYADNSNIVAANSAPKYVLAEQLDSQRRQNEQVSSKLAALEAKQKELVNAAALKEVSAIRHNFEIYERKGSERFTVAVFCDDKFTYIELEAQEAPSVWEIRDGKLSKIEAPLRDGKYTIPHLVDEGELKVGKSSVKFRRLGKV